MFSFIFQGPIGLDGPKGDPVSVLHLYILSVITRFVVNVLTCAFASTQGRPGDKGQKGEHGSPGFDVFSAVKVRLLKHLY